MTAQEFIAKIRERREAKTNVEPKVIKEFLEKIRARADAERKSDKED